MHPFMSASLSILLDKWFLFAKRHNKLNVFLCLNLEYVKRHVCMLGLGDIKCFISPNNSFRR